MKYVIALLLFLTTTLGYSFSDQMNEPLFDKGFEWCVATSAHQIEGNNFHSDWWAFEQEGHIKNNETSGLATNHIELWQEDIALMKELGVTTYRFSVEWAKIEPKKGEFNEEAMMFYVNLVNELEKNNIKPFVTLHHFTLPNWLRLDGGWANKESIERFELFADFVYKHIGDKVNYWITTNEPMLYLLGGYAFAEVPPMKNTWADIGAPLVNLVKAHAAVYKLLHHNRNQEESRTPIHVGIANHFRIFKAHRAINPLDQVAAFYAQRALNNSFLDAINDGELVLYFPTMINLRVHIPEAKGTQDFVGVNYYKRDEVKFIKKAPFLEIGNFSNKEASDLNWEIYSKGLKKVVEKTLKKYDVPIFITENGIADKSDSKRPDFIASHLKVLSNIKRGKSRILGYCHWSLLDNFEWREGFDPRFGLVEIDYETFERKPRDSFYYYKSIIRKNK